MMDRTPKFLGLTVAIIMVGLAFLLPSAGILASPNADPGTITIIDTENQSGSLTNFEYALESPGNPSWLMAWCPL